MPSELIKYQDNRGLIKLRQEQAVEINRYHSHKFVKI